MVDPVWQSAGSLQMKERATGIRFLGRTGFRVDVTSSDFPAFDRNHNTGAPFHSDTELLVASQTLFHDADHPSRIVLPTLPD